MALQYHSEEEEKRMFPLSFTDFLSVPDINEYINSPFIQKLGLGNGEQTTSIVYSSLIAFVMGISGMTMSELIGMESDKRKELGDMFIRFVRDFEQKDNDPDCSDEEKLENRVQVYRKALEGFELLSQEKMPHLNYENESLNSLEVKKRILMLNTVAQGFTNMESGIIDNPQILLRLGEERFCNIHRIIGDACEITGLLRFATTEERGESQIIGNVRWMQVLKDRLEPASGKTLKEMVSNDRTLAAAALYGGQFYKDYTSNLSEELFKVSYDGMNNYFVGSSNADEIFEEVPKKKDLELADRNRLENWKLAVAETERTVQYYEKAYRYRLKQAASDEEREAIRQKMRDYVIRESGEQNSLLPAALLRRKENGDSLNKEEINDASFLDRDFSITSMFSEENLALFLDSDVLEAFGFDLNSRESVYAGVMLLAMGFTGKNAAELAKMDREELSSLGEQMTVFAQNHTTLLLDLDGNPVSFSPEEAERRRREILDTFFRGLQQLVGEKVPEFDMKYPEVSDIDEKKHAVTLASILTGAKDFLREAENDPQILQNVGLDAFDEMDRTISGAQHLMNALAASVCVSDENGSDSVLAYRAVQDQRTALRSYRGKSFAELNQVEGYAEIAFLVDPHENETYHLSNEGHLNNAYHAITEDGPAASKFITKMIDDAWEDRNQDDLDKQIAARRADARMERSLDGLRKEQRELSLKNDLLRQAAGPEEKLEIENAFRDYEEISLDQAVKENPYAIIYDEKGDPHPHNYLKALKDGEQAHFYIGEKNIMSEGVVRGNGASGTVQINKRRMCNVHSFDYCLMKNCIKRMLADLKDVDSRVIKSSDEFKAVKQSLEALSNKLSEKNIYRDEIGRDIVDLVRKTDLYLNMKYREKPLNNHSPYAISRMHAIEKIQNGLEGLLKTEFYEQDHSNLSQCRRMISPAECYLCDAHESGKSETALRSIREIQVINDFVNLKAVEAQEVGKALVTLLLVDKVRENCPDTSKSSDMRAMDKLLNNRKFMDAFLLKIAEEVPDELRNPNALIKLMKSPQRSDALYDRCFDAAMLAIKEQKKAEKAKKPEKQVNQEKQLRKEM